MLISKSAMKSLKDYSPLVHQLVKKELKKKYRRSILGYLWSLLNPLMMMVIMSFVFSSIFKSNVEHFPLYCIIGNTLYTFFSESTNQGMESILNNSSLIKKVYIPKFIFPISSVSSSFVNMSFNLTAILIVKIVMRVPFHFTDLLFFVPLALEFIFCMGMSLILSSLLVYFRDMRHLYQVLTLAWMYMTPIFYSVDSMPDEVIKAIECNPIYHYLLIFRSYIIYGELVGIQEILTSLAISSLVFVIGLVVFRRAQRNFILYI